MSSLGLSLSKFTRKSTDFPKSWNHPTDIYQVIQKNPDTHSIVGLLDEQLVCQIDLILAEASDLGKHIRVSGKDCVARFLFGNPPIVQQALITAFLTWYFEFPEAGHLYAIPDIQNHNYCRVLESARFVFHCNCILTQQAVSIYRVTNTLFNATH
ncbi:MAG TPA: GNAT family N-acetyltransferase [Chitinophagaceae bacterium]